MPTQNNFILGGKAMRRVFQKGIAVALAAAMVITAAPAGQAGAAKKASMAKKTSVAVGKTVTIKIKNSSKKAKVSWKTSSKKVAKITKQVKKGAKASAKVKGVKKGTAKITATYKVGKKSQKFVCKVTVKKAGAKVTTPSATPSTKPATASPANTATAAPTNPIKNEPTAEPTVEPTKGPTATPRPSATPSAAPKNTSLDATKLGDADTITVDGTVNDAEWENAGKEQNLLANTMSVRGKLTDGTTATAQIAWTDTAVYVGIKSSAEMSEAKFFIDEDGDAANANAKSATATLSSDKKQAEAKIDLAAAPDVEKGLKTEIQLKIGDATVNFFDSVTEIEYNKDKDEWNFKDNGIKAGTDDSVLGTLNLLPSMAQATSAYFTDKQAEILAEAKIPEGDDTFEEIAEGVDWTVQKTKKMTFVDTKYWTDAYAANGSQSIFFTNVNIPDWQGNAEKVGLATKNEDGTFTSSRDNAQGYIIWDKQYLYVLFDINDSDISPANTDHYTTDSTEFFLDEDYSQPSEYTTDGTGDEVQLRVDAADGAFSSNGAGTGNYQLVAHAVNYKKDADDKTTGYQVEYIIKLNKEHTNGQIMGMDLQINDCYTTYTYLKDEEGNDTEEIDTTVDPTASRAATLTAYDTTNNDYQYPNCFGRVKLINKGEAEPEVTPVPKSYTATQTSEEITIDGTEDAAYAAAAEMPFNSRIVCPGVTDANASNVSATAKMLWNENNLYGFVKVKDSSISSGASAEHEKDGLEIFLDEDNCGVLNETDGNAWANEDAFQYRYTGLTKNDEGVAQDALVAKIAGAKDAELYKDSIEVKYTFTEDGYNVEFKVAFKEAKAVDAILGFDLIVQDSSVVDGADKREAELYLVETDAGKSYWNNKAAFGQLKLIAAEPEKDEYHVDITKFKTNGKVTATVNEDGSVTLDWPADAGDWANIECIFDKPVDLSKYTKYIVKTKGGETLFCANILDATKKSQWGAKASVGLKYGFDTNKETTLKSLLNADYNGDNEGGTDADYTNVAGVSFNKNNEAKAVSTTITDIIFY